MEDLVGKVVCDHPIKDYYYAQVQDKQINTELAGILALILNFFFQGKKGWILCEI